MPPYNYNIQPVDPNAFARGIQQAYMPEQIRSEIGLQQAQAGRLQQQQQRLQAYTQAVEVARANPTADNLSALMTQFPEYAQELRQAYQTQAEGQQRRNVDAAASIWALLQRGQTDRALRLLEERRTALAGAGESTEVTDGIMEAIRSGDPARLRDAQFIAGMVLASADPDQVGSTLNSLTDATRRRVVENDGIFYDADTLEPIVQSPYTRIIPGPDGSFYEQERVPTIPVAGGRASTSGGASGEQPSAGASPLSAWTVQSVPGDPRDGGARSHQGYDLFPPRGGSPAIVAPRGWRIENVRTGPRQGITADVIFEDGSRWTMMHLRERPTRMSGSAGEPVAIAGNTGNARSTPTHVHMEGRDGQGNPLDPRRYFGMGAQGLPQVRSRQAYERLPRGARYIAPDGTVRTKS